jgi:hypothetical protein
MGGKRPEQDTDEFIQSLLERRIQEQCSLHDWAAAVSTANPLDVLMMLEEDDHDIDPIIGLKGRTA